MTGIKKLAVSLRVKYLEQNQLSFEALWVNMELSLVEKAEKEIRP